MEGKKDLKIGKMNTAIITDRGVLQKITVLVFFTIYLVVGLTAYKDYGISWDEPVSRERGILSLKYVLEGDQELVNTDWMYHHGAAFEISLVAVEAILGLTKDIKSVYLTRHLLTFLLFYTSVVFFYFLGKRSFDSWRAGLLGCAFLILSPRIFAHSFFNPKDIPFLSLFIISLYTMILLFDKKTQLHAMFHGLACALLIDVRIVGAVVPLLTLGFLCFDYLRAVRKERNNRAAALGLGFSVLGAIALIWCVLPGSLLNHYLCGLTGFESALANSLTLVTVLSLFFLLRSIAIDVESKTIATCATVFALCLIVFTTLFWPILWSNPLGGLLNTFSHTTTFPWPYTVLYMGSYTEANALPWHYLPVWIGISTPLLYCMLFVLGYCRIIISAISGPRWWFSQKRHEFIYLGLITSAIGGVILFKPVLYDGWRQMYFIYPVFILIAVGGLWGLLSWCKRPYYRGIVNVASLTALAAVGLSLIWTAKTMVVTHPFQNVYFNRLAGASMNKIKSDYDLDYWGISYRQALEYIVKHDGNERIFLYADNYPAKANVKILDEKDRKRLVFVDKLEDATYFLGNYRWHKEEYSHGREYFSVKLKGAKIVAVHKVGETVM